MAREIGEAAQAVAARLWQGGARVLPAEVMVLDPQTAAIIVDVDGVDYVLSMQRVPKQRPRPRSN